jgi:hypothetical protein
MFQLSFIFIYPKKGNVPRQCTCDLFEIPRLMQLLTEIKGEFKNQISFFKGVVKNRYGSDLPLELENELRITS